MLTNTMALVLGQSTLLLLLSKSLRRKKQVWHLRWIVTSTNLRA